MNIKSSTIIKAWVMGLFFILIMLIVYLIGPGHGRTALLIGFTIGILCAVVIRLLNYALYQKVQK